MAIEYVMLALSVTVLIVIVGTSATFGIFEMGAMPLAGPRDNLPERSPFLKRLYRTVDNHREGLIMFAPLVLIAGATDNFNETTAIGSQLFAYSRIVHAPVYILGIPVIRPLIFFVGLIGIVMILFSLFF